MSVLCYSPEVDKSELFNVFRLRETLIFKIHSGLEEEIAVIQDCIEKVHSDFQVSFYDYK